MLRKLINKLKNMNRDANPFDPSKFNDPIAMQTDWTPVKSGGSSFQSHKLVVTDPNRVEFRATIGAKAFYLIFLFAGIAIFLGFVAARLSAGNFAFDVGTNNSFISRPCFCIYRRQYVVFWNCASSL